ncbi:ABC transporter permease [Thiohalophilus thiocyanatoxydans]|uniref:Putative ABC transport system permease protein n=1 Tax=Thiohalophilus thiocyanatoxydans TaxID=381308 RepID=A0A4R8IMH5_9GAMM|nr:iron export ABC transporter permease subunit FetB [Thiohalophilus thiocyanatoxydans]TDX96881.1 putative ABC transport system permease protein [Thiohalophilus thiocyanatoxydans]
MNIISLTPLDLGLAALLVVALAGISLWLRLGVTQRLLIAALRTTLQLLLVGLILKVLFENVTLLWVVLISSVMVLIAGREVMARQQRPFRGRWGYALGTLSMFVSAFATTLFALLIIINNDPWYQPQYAIPLLGMMLGNTMTGVALSLDRLTNNAWQQRAVIETRLALGQRWQDALRETVRESVRVGLIPIINAMAAAGIVSLPGMMTGQILSGTAPVEAVKYQILIMFMIAAGTGFAILIASWLGARRLFDERERLRLDRLREARE